MIAFSRINRHPIGRVCWVGLIGALIAGGVISTRLAANAAPETHVVTIENMRFSPDALEVHGGDRIVWINKDLFPHTATADTKAFDSRSIEPDASWSYVVAKPGEYPYGCALHPTMRAKLTVR